MKVKFPIVDLLDNLENYYLQKINFIENLNTRDNIKVNELENIEEMAELYELEYVSLMAQESIERIMNGS